jgi:prepilin-type N-terminal cleavage/methylation domain-containing protein
MRGGAKASLPSFSSGFSLLELVVVMALLSLVMVVSVPALFEATTTLRMRQAAREVAGAMYEARFEAIRMSARVGVKFYPPSNEDGPTLYRLYRDGDGDGVRSDDIRSLTDPPVGPVRRMDRVGQRIYFGFPPGIDAPAPGVSGAPLGNLADPIRFNRSDIASFSGIGGSTPGTLYLTDGKSRLTAIRVTSRTGRIVIARWDAERRRWLPG